MKKKVLLTSFATFFVACVLILMCLFTTACSNNNDANKDHGPVTYQIPEQGSNSLTFGHLDVDCSTEEILKHFSYGDLLKVKIEGCDEMLMPLCADYGDVSPGELVIRAKEGKPEITLAINYGQLGVKLGFLQKATEGSNTKYTWINGKLPCSVTFSLGEQGAYKDRLEVGKLKESNERDAYQSLSDEQFANFREVKVGSIRSGVFYRSSTPIDPQLNRNTQADQACANHGIASILNLQDSQAEAQAFPGFANTYYSKTNVTYQKMAMSLGTTEFNNNIANCMRFYANNQGPYMCHCVYGKDRTGFVCAVVEGLCGASLDEIKADYLATYTNFYNVVDGKQQPIDDSLKKTIEDIIVSNLQYAYGTDVNASNVNQKTEEYVKSIGITQDEINKIRTNLK